MSSFWRYLFIGIALMTWPKTWPVGIDHCCVCYCFHGNVSKYAADLRHYLDTNQRAEKYVTAINISLKTSIDLYNCLRSVCVRACVRACLRACVRVCVCENVCGIRREWYLCISMLRYFPRCDLGLEYKFRFMCIILHHILALLILKYIT